MILNILEFTGDNQVRFTNLSEEQAVEASERKEVDLADLYLMVPGYGKPAEDSDINIGIAYSSGLGQVANFTLTEGRVPEADNEAAIPPHLAEALGIEPGVGAEFEILLYQTSDNQTLQEAELLRFVVSGILQEQQVYAALGVYDMFVSRNFAEQYDFSTALYLRFDPSYDPRFTALAIAEEIGLGEEEVTFNENYLAANLNDPTTVVLVSVVLLVLSAAGALVIHNAYNISVVKRIHQYGLLTVIGASRKQIRGCVYLEALICAGIGLPFGLLIGTLMGYVSTLAISGITTMTTSYVLTPLAYLLSAAVTILMVLVGVMRPASKAARIAPIEAVRFSDAGETAKKRKTLENVTLNALARINLTRSRGRTVGTILSLSLSGILFLGFSTIAFSMLDSVNTLTSQMVMSDIQIDVEQYRDVDESNDPLSLEIVEIISQLDGVEETTTVMRQGLFILSRDYESAEGWLSQGNALGIAPEVMQEVIDSVYGTDVTLENLVDPHNVIAVIPSDRSIEFFFEMYNIDYTDILDAPPSLATP